MCLIELQAGYLRIDEGVLLTATWDLCLVSNEVEEAVSVRNVSDGISNFNFKLKTLFSFHVRLIEV